MTARNRFANSALMGMVQPKQSAAKSEDKRRAIPSYLVTEIVQEWEHWADGGKIKYTIHLQRRGNSYSVKVVTLASYGSESACMDFIQKNGLAPYKRNIGKKKN